MLLCDRSLIEMTSENNDQMIVITQFAMHVSVSVAMLFIG